MPERHLVASEGLLAAASPAHDLVRIGLAFYGELGVGFRPDPAMAAAANALRPALTLLARPVRIETLPAGARVGYGGEWEAERPSTIATLPIGYADGWPRAAWPGSEALARGRRVPLVGRVSMDSVCVDLTDVPGATLDDEVVLLGAQGGDRITVDEVAAHRGTIPNEVLATLGMRLPRRYLRAGRIVAVADRPERVHRLDD
jgi:alanine racemase